MSIVSPELLLLIFDKASVQTLAWLSLCSHQFRILAFPLLNRHVVLKKHDALARFSSRVISEANAESLVDDLRVAEHVHHLEIGASDDAADEDDRDETDEEDQMALLTSALQHLNVLRGITWSAMLPEDPAIFSVIQTTCSNLQHLTLHLGEGFDGDDDDYMSILFGFKGLTRLEISTHSISLDSDQIPSSMVDMICASPNLIALELSLETYGDPHPKWDIDTLFLSIDIAPTSLKLRKVADLDIHAFSDPTKPTPFRSFLLSHHEGITSLALPAPQEDFAHGPPSLNLPPGTLPALREFEGTIYWCSQIAKLQVASKLESLTVLLERPLFEDDKCRMLLDALHAFSSLKVLNILDGETFLLFDELQFIVQSARHLESLTCAFARHETADTIGSQLSGLNLRALAANISRYGSNVPHNVSEEFVRTLAKYCHSLVTVEDLDQRDYGMRWVATIIRKESGIDLEVSHTRI